MVGQCQNDAQKANAADAAQKAREKAKEELFLKYQASAKPGLETRDVFEECYEKMKMDYLNAPKARRQDIESYHAALLTAGIEGCYANVEYLAEPVQNTTQVAVQNAPQAQVQNAPQAPVQKPEEKNDGWKVAPHQAAQKQAVQSTQQSQPIQPPKQPQPIQPASNTQKAYTLELLIEEYEKINQYKLNSKAECLEALSQIREKPSSADLIAKALYTAGSIGLSVRPALKQGWIATRGTIFFEPMYQGLIDIAIADNVISYVEAREICVNDFYKSVFGSNQFVEHIPPIRNRGEICGVYAKFIIPTSTGIVEKFETFDDAMCEKFKKMWVQKGYIKPAARDHLEMMLRKSVLKRGLKCLRTSERLSLAIAIDNDSEPDDSEPEQPKTAAEIL